REIGLRMAIGARGKDVLLQFLVEAIVISLIGGMIGIGLGFGLSAAVQRFMQWPSAISPDAIAPAFGFASLTGVLFGVYPSLKTGRGPMTQTYKLDGSETESAMGQMTAKASAKWDGDKLVITTKTDNGEQTQTLSLDAGKLTVERTSGRGPSKTVYKKTT